MNINYIKNLPIENKNQYGIICFGYISLYQSERKVVSNYIKMNNLSKEIINSKNLFLKEKTREEKYRVLEQDGYSFIFDSKIWSYFSYIKELSKNINMFIFDSLFLKSSYVNDVVLLFKNATNNEIDVEELKRLDESIELTDGFINKRVGLI